MKVRGWFTPAFGPGEDLRAALMATPYPLTVVNTLVAKAKELIGRNHGRVLLLSDQAIHVAGRRFWRRRFRVLLASCPLARCRLAWSAGELRIDGEPF